MIGTAKIVGEMSGPSANGPLLTVRLNRTRNLEIECYDIDAATELVVEATDVFRFFVWATDGAAPDINADSNALPSANFTADAGTDVITSAAHGLSDGDAVILTTSAADLPDGLAILTTYWVRDSDANTFKLAATSGGTAIDILDAGTGTHTWTQTASAIVVDTVGVADTTPATVTVTLDQVDTANLTAGTRYKYELAIVDDSDGDKIKTLFAGQMECVGSATGDIGLS